MAFVFVTSFALIAAATVSSITHWVALQNAQRDESQSLAQVLSSNLAASVMFRDEMMARTLLASLSVRQDVDCALVIDQFGQVFAAYELTKSACKLGRQPGNMGQTSFIAGTGLAVASIGSDENRFGSLVIQVNQHNVWASLKRILLILSGALLGVLGVAVLFSRWLSGLIAEPINGLSRLMTEVAEAGRYSARAEEAGPREVRQLGRAFNHMLQQIESRGQALLRHQQELEGRIAEATVELHAKQVELEILARTDGLTGLDNRRYFMEQANQEFRRTQRQGRPLSVIMMDVDHFKRVNDTYGHQVGDRVLEGIARVLRGGVRDADLVGRLGGEEFALILPETDAAAAREMAERLCKAASGWRGKAPAVDPSLQVTCSFGVATWQPGTSNPLEYVFRLADEALYKAKQQGRNRVVQA